MVSNGEKPKKGGILGEGPPTQKMSPFCDDNPIAGCDFDTPKIALELLPAFAQIFPKPETFPHHFGAKKYPPFSTPKSTVFSGGKLKKGAFQEGVHRPPK